jgi:putative hydrolase of the HAD superfamily
MIDAVLFDYGDTLMQFAYEPELIEAGHRAGLAAVGRDGLPESEEVAARFREAYEPLLWARDGVDELEYPGLVRRLLADFGLELDDDELARFLEAEHVAWAPARLLGAHTHALLESLRARGLRLAIVSNAFDPGWLLRRDLDELGLAERVDHVVFSSEVGKRKPHASIFEAALAALDVEAGRALFVGDRLREDVAGAAGVGMRTVQALWFRADDANGDVAPDFEAFTPHDVLNVVRRLNGET